MTDADTVREALQKYPLAEQVHAARAALDRLEAELDAERRARKAVEDVKADEVLRERTNLEAQIESLVAERDAAIDALEVKAAEFLALIGDVEAERDRLAGVVDCEHPDPSESVTDEHGHWWRCACGLEERWEGGMRVEWRIVDREASGSGV